MKKRVIRVHGGGIASDEEGGVYHPEDDEPAPRAASTPVVSAPSVIVPSPRSEMPSTPLRKPRVETQRETLPEENKPELKPELKPEVPSEEPTSKVHIGEPSDAFSRETLENEALVGSDENPIVQYGKQ